MASPRLIKNRIRSTKNIKQITKAMEAVSAVKMRRSQEIALRSRPYAYAALAILKSLSADTSLHERYQSPLLKQRPVKKICLAVVTSDKGLCGAFNSNVLRKAQLFITNTDVPVELFVIGKKAKDFAKKHGYPLAGEMAGIGDYARIEQTTPIANALEELFISGACDEVHAVYTNFVSVLKQEVVVEQLLPFSKEEIERRVREVVPEEGKYSDVPATEQPDDPREREYAYEPSVNNVLDALLPQLLEIAAYHIVLEANASEHSARMVTMKNASENASDLIGALTLSYNKARQAQITNEIIEVTGGAAALENA